MKSFIFYIICTLIPFLGFSQKESSNWYFGNKAAISFKYGTPVALTNSVMVSYPGSASISDENGNLLFYTNGFKIYNKNHQLMDNGDSLKGTQLSDQCVIIVPHPGIKFQYYIFTIGDPTPMGSGSFYYSIVDITLNNGSGKVIKKNCLIATGITAKMSAVKHANKSSVWIITHLDKSDGFVCFLLTKYGLILTPVKTYIGVNNNTTNTSRSSGFIRCSSDGKTLAASWTIFNKIDIFNFNNSTGTLSNIKTISIQQPYGVEFSPNSRLLYFSCYVGIKQVDLWAGSSAQIQNSIVSLKSGLSMGGFQIATNKKIYFTTNTNAYFLSCIEFPDKSDTFCRLIDSAVNLAGNNSTLGLPLFLQSYFFKPDFEAKNTCKGDTTLFSISDTSKVDSVSWDFDNFASGTANYSKLWNPKHYFADTGLFNVKMIVWHDSITDTFAREIRISPYPKADFIINDNVQCLGANFFKFTNNTAISSGLCSYEWHFGDSKVSYDTNTKHEYTYEDSFTVKMYALSDYGCMDSVSKMVYVFPPKADFKVISDTDFCLSGNKFTFVNKTKHAFGTVSYKWLFGDGNSSTVSDTVTHSYSAPDTFNVQLIATSNFSCSDTLTRQIIVFPMPKAAFSINDSIQCFNEHVFIINQQSKVNGGNIIKWNWYLNDSLVSKVKNIYNITLSRPETCNLKLVCLSANSCFDSVSHKLVVNSSPKTLYSINDSIQCFKENNFILFNPFDSLNPPNIKSWDFGDGLIVYQDTVIHTYTTADTFKLTLIEETDLGCKDTASGVIIVLPSPVAAFSINDSTQCFNEQNFVMTDLSKITLDSISTNIWIIGNDTIRNQKSAIRNNFQPATWNLQLVTHSSSGCPDTIVKQLSVYPSPNVIFTIDRDSQCLKNNLFTFTSSSSPSGLQHLWNFGNGNSGTQTIENESFKNSGTYKVNLIVTTNDNCMDTSEKTVVVHPIPVAGFNVDSNTQCLTGNNFVFTNTSSCFDKPFTFNWSFGDSSGQVTSQNTTHSYNHYGAKDVQLIVTSPFNCRDTFIQKLNILPSPTASFILNGKSQCYIGNECFVTDKSSCTVSFKSTFNFGDGHVVTNNKALHSYDSSGKYIIMLTVESKDGCLSTTYDTTTIHPNPQPKITINDENQCFKNNMFLLSANDTSYKISPDSLIFKWYFGNGDSSDSHTPKYHYPKVDSYIIDLYLFSLQGCEDIAHQSVLISPMPKAIFEFNHGCLDSIISFTESSDVDSPDKLIKWKWDFDNGDISYSKNPSYTYSIPGNYQVSLIVESDKTCIDTTTQHITVYQHVDPIILDRATVVDENVLVEWIPPSTGNPKAIILEKSANNITFNELSRQTPDIDSFTDLMVAVNKKSYTYRIYTIDSCDHLSLESNIGKSILLKVDTSDQFPVISWTPYEYWKKGIANYELQIAGFSKWDEPKDKNFVSFGNFPFPDAISDSISKINADNYCYRVVSYRNDDNKESVSNEVCIPAICHLFIPNVFTPNDDNLNDFFKPRGIYILEYNLQIFSRWGEKVFETNDIKEGWDGKFKEEICPIGEYIYQVTAIGTGNQGKTVVGTVMLMR